MGGAAKTMRHKLRELSRIGAVALEGRAVVAASFARELAAAMLYPGDDGDPYFEGRDAGLILRGLHPDVTELGGAVGIISVDAIRELRKEAFLKPNQAPGRVFILLNAASMTTQAQNALLKILEEPPGNVRFILTIENRHNLLSTVQSRLVTIQLEESSVPPGDNLPESVREVAALAGDWEQTVELLGLKAAVRLFADCEAAFEAICDGNAYRLMSFFAAREKRRDEFLCFCHSLRCVCVRRLINMGADFPRLQRAARVLDETAEMAGQNVFLPLLGSHASLDIVG